MAQVSAEERLRASLSADEWTSIDTFRKFLRIRTISAEGPKGVLIIAAQALLASSPFQTNATPMYHSATWFVMLNRPGAYQEAVAFLQQLFNDAGVVTTTKEYLPGKPVLVATIPGTQPELKRFVVYRHLAFRYMLNIVILLQRIV